MKYLLTIIGWSIHILNLLFMFSGSYYIVRTAQQGGKISYTSLFWWGLSTTCALIFSFTGWNKLHLLWIIPIGVSTSWTFIGQYIGYLIGYITNFLLSPLLPPHVRNINKNDITDDDFE